MTRQAELRSAALARGETVYAGSKCYTCGYRIRITRTARCATCERNADRARREELHARIEREKSVRKA
jgi:hypothetical protein